MKKVLEYNFKNYIGGNIEKIPVTIDVLTKGFPEMSGINYENLQLTNEGLFSISGQKGSKLITDLIIEYYGSTDLTITDGTANNGSDTIMFGLNFVHVNSIELNPVNYEVLLNNIAVYNLQNKITTFNDDTLNLLNDLTQDVIYIDAPWGGKDYKKHYKLRLYLGDMELSDIFLKFKNKAKMFVFKVPYNYDFNNMIYRLNTYNIHIHNYIDSRDRVKFRIIFIKT